MKNAVQEELLGTRVSIVAEHPNLKGGGSIDFGDLDFGAASIVLAVKSFFQLILRRYLYSIAFIPLFQERTDFNIFVIFTLLPLTATISNLGSFSEKRLS